MTAAAVVIALLLSAKNVYPRWKSDTCLKRMCADKLSSCIVLVTTGKSSYGILTTSFKIDVAADELICLVDC